MTSSERLRLKKNEAVVSFAGDKAYTIKCLSGDRWTYRVVKGATLIIRFPKAEDTP